MFERTGFNTNPSPGFATKTVKTSSTSTATPKPDASSTTGGVSGHETSSGADAATETGGVKTSAASSPGKQLALATYTSMLFAVGVMVIMAQ